MEEREREIEPETLSLRIEGFYTNRQKDGLRKMARGLQASMAMHNGIHTNQCTTKKMVFHNVAKLSLQPLSTNSENDL